MSAQHDDNLRRMIAHHDSWAATYDEDISGMVLYNRITWDNIQRFLPEDREGVILDAGGGTGFWSIRIAELGYRVVMVDVSVGMLEKARENVAARGLADLVEVRFGDIRSMPEFADGEFAMVVSEGDPVSYCGDPGAAVEEFARVVRSGGAVIVSVDNRASAINWLSKGGDLDAIEDYLATGDVRVPMDPEASYVVHAFTPEEIKELFESSGLTVERILGKPVTAKLLTLADPADPAVQERLYQLEMRYCDDPAFYPWGGHIEIVGRRG